MLSACTLWAQPLAPSELATEDRVNPIGVGDATPEFSWIPADSQAGASQAAFQILVSSRAELLAGGEGDKWGSGKVASTSVAFHSYAGKSLRAGEICYWKVRTWNRKGEVSPWSQAATFEMGLLENSDWGVHWIWRDSSEPDDYTYLRKTVSLRFGLITRARA